MKWLGALFVLAASGWIGMAKVAHLRREIHIADRLVPLLSLMQRELGQRGTPLPEILHLAAEQGLLERPRLESLAAKLRAGESLSLAAEPVFIGCSFEIVQPLQALGTVLGRYDSITQSKACEQAVAQLTAYRQNLSKELALKGRLYGVIPIAFGLMAVLLLF